VNVEVNARFLNLQFSIRGPTSDIKILLSNSVMEVIKSEFIINEISSKRNTVKTKFF